MTQVFGKNVFYFTVANIYKPRWNEKKEGEVEVVVVQNKGAKKN